MKRRYGGRTTCTARIIITVDEGPSACTGSDQSTERCDSTYKSVLDWCCTKMKTRVAGSRRESNGVTIATYQGKILASKPCIARDNPVCSARSGPSQRDIAAAICRSGGLKSASGMIVDLDDRGREVKTFTPLGIKNNSACATGTLTCPRRLLDAFGHQGLTGVQLDARISNDPSPLGCSGNSLFCASASR